MGTKCMLTWLQCENCLLTFSVQSYIQFYNFVAMTMQHHYVKTTKNDLNSFVSQVLTDELM